MTRATLSAVLLVLALAGCDTRPLSAVAPPSCRPPLVAATMIELYFGRAMPGGREVSDAQWAAFLAQSISPRFPDGLTVIDGQGQSGDGSGRIVPERTKLVQLGVRDGAAAASKVDAVIADYKQRFQQIGVFRVERPVCASL